MSSHAFITLQRRSLESWLWDMPAKQTKVALTLMLMANFKTGTTFSGGEMVTIERGQVMTSLEALALRSRTSIQTVKTTLKNLEKAKFLTSQSTNRHRIITIVNYRREQAENAGFKHAANKPLTSDQQAVNRPLTTIEQGNKGTREQELSSSVPKTVPRKKSGKPKREPKPVPPQALAFARSLADAIASRQPGSRPAREPEKCAKSWANDIDKIHRLDKRPWEAIGKVLNWSQRDPFWQNNIMSGSKLRDQFDQLESKMGNSQADETGHYQHTGDEEYAGKIIDDF